MRTKEQIKRIREQAQADLKKDFTPGEKPPVKKATPKKYGSGGFGR